MAKATKTIVPAWLGLLVIAGALWLVVRIVTGGELIAGAYVGPAEREAERQASEIREARVSAQIAVRAQLKDGESARFQLVSAKRHENVVLICGNVNAKNSFGAYNGFRPFVYSTANDFAFFAEMMESPKAFQEAWNSSCT